MYEWMIILLVKIINNVWQILILSFPKDVVLLEDGLDWYRPKHAENT